jgi:hypothetical protein
MSQTQLTLRVPSQLHKALKLASVNEDRSIQDIAIEALTARMLVPKRAGLADFFELRDRLLADAEPGEFDIEREEWVFPESNIFDTEN